MRPQDSRSAFRLHPVIPADAVRVVHPSGSGSSVDSHRAPSSGPIRAEESRRRGPSGSREAIASLASSRSSPFPSRASSRSWILRLCAWSNVSDFLSVSFSSFSSWMSSIVAGSFPACPEGPRSSTGINPAGWDCHESSISLPEGSLGLQESPEGRPQFVMVNSHLHPPHGSHPAGRVGREHRRLEAAVRGRHRLR